MKPGTGLGFYHFGRGLKLWPIKNCELGQVRSNRVSGPRNVPSHLPCSDLICLKTVTLELTIVTITCFLNRKLVQLCQLQNCLIEKLHRRRKRKREGRERGREWETEKENEREREESVKRSMKYKIQ